MSSDRVVLPTQLYPSHYALEITPDFTALTFGCDEEIEVEVREATNAVTLHAREITIQSASFVSADGRIPRLQPSSKFVPHLSFSYPIYAIALLHL